MPHISHLSIAGNPTVTPQTIDPGVVHAQLPFYQQTTVSSESFLPVGNSTPLHLRLRLALKVSIFIVLTSDQPVTSGTSLVRPPFPLRPESPPPCMQRLSGCVM